MDTRPHTPEQANPPHRKRIQPNSRAHQLRNSGVHRLQNPGCYDTLDRRSMITVPLRKPRNSGSPEIQWRAALSPYLVRAREGRLCPSAFGTERAAGDGDLDCILDSCPRCKRIGETANKGIACTGGVDWICGEGSYVANAAPSAPSVTRRRPLSPAAERRIRGSAGGPPKRNSNSLSLGTFQSARARASA